MMEKRPVTELQRKPGFTTEGTSVLFHASLKVRKKTGGVTI